MTEICVTGATGFLGRHFVARCLAQSNVHLRLLTRRKASLADLDAERVTIVEGDLKDAASLENFIGAGSVLVHLAYLHEGSAANLAATRNLARAALEAGVRRVVHCSTAVVVGFSAGGIVDERTPPSPRGEYQETKYAIEQIFLEKLGSGVELAIARPTEIIGPGGEGLRAMIGRIASESESRNAIYRLMLGNRRFNYVSVENVVDVLMLLATTAVPQVGEVYNVSDDDDPDNRYAKVEEIIRTAVGKPPSRVVVSVPAGVLSLLFRALPGAAPPNRVYSAAKLGTVGFRKRKSLRSAVIDLVTHELADRAGSTRGEQHLRSDGDDLVRPEKHAN